MANSAFETVYPLRRQGKQLVPFPTVYWLVDPRLDHALADLERQGVIRELQQSVGRDEALRRALRQAHRDYARSRWAMLSRDDQREVQAAGLEPTMRQRGVGGVSNFDSIKCLHAHYAHHLAQHNPVGELLEMRLRDGGVFV